MNPQWITCWSKSQRGLGLVSHLYHSHQCIHIKLPKAWGCKLRFALYYDEQEVLLTNVRCIHHKEIYTVTFAQEVSIQIQPQSTILSDAILFPQEVEELTIQYDLACASPLHSGIQLYPYDPIMCDHDLVYGLCGIDILTTEIKGCVRVIGDSISEQGTWTTPFANWLQTRGYQVLNHGISGNRLLRELETVQIDTAHSYLFEDTVEEKLAHIVGTHKGIALGKQCFGIAADKRIPKQVLVQDQGVLLHILALGTNDLYQPGTFCAAIDELPTLEEYMDAFRSCVECIKQQGSRCIVLGIPPFLGADQVDEKKEKLRQRMNKALKEEAQIDAVVFFDDLLMNAEGTWIDAYHKGDYLHPSAAGGLLMAKRIEEVVNKWLG